MAPATGPPKNVAGNLHGLPMGHLGAAGSRDCPRGLGQVVGELAYVAEIIFIYLFVNT